MKPYWQIGLLTAKEANSLCDKEEQNKAFDDKNHPSTEELDFLNIILNSVKLDAERKSFDWMHIYYARSHQKLLPRICILLNELGYGASTMYFKDSNDFEYCRLVVTWV